jgi:hypothetical protein
MNEHRPLPLLKRRQPDGTIDRTINNEGGAEALDDQRIHNETTPTILTPEALVALKERIIRKGLHPIAQL